MNEKKHKAILLEGNAAIARGDYEGFLVHCSDDSLWTFVGDRVLKGKNEIRQWMATSYIEPPIVEVDNLVAEGDFLTVYGKIAVKDKSGKSGNSAYCDIWRFEGGKIIELKAFVIESKE